MRGGKAARKTDPTVGWPLRLVLFPMVIAVAALLVALTIYPAFAGLVAAQDGFQQRLAEYDDDYQTIRFPESSTIYWGSADGGGRDPEVMTTVDAGENRKYVRLGKVAPIAQTAVLAIEDDKFYEHGPIDPEAILRAAITNYAAGEVEQGGSTITQQLVKQGIIGSSEQTFERKFQEMALAARMERELEKDDILELYLNEVYFANGVYGIGTASQFYFRRPASKLRLPQAALLAGMIASPNEFDPIHNPKAAKTRRDVVLDRMAELDDINKKEAAKAKKSGLELRVTKIKEKTQPFAVQYVTSQLLDTENHAFDKVLGTTREERERNLGKDGLSVYTTLDEDWIRSAQQTAANSLGLRAERQAAIATVEVGTGAIRMLMSGQNYDREQRNLVVSQEVDGEYQGVRQPGSAFKPFTLAAAFEEGIPPETRYSSKSPMKIPEWDNDCHCVSNAEPFSNSGNIDLWDATANSVNVVFAQLALDVGPENIADVAERMGITTPLVGHPSITLGSEEAAPLDMASAFATLAHEGTYCRTFVISRIVNSKGERVYKHDTKQACREAIDPDIARLVTQMLEGVVQHGTGTAAQLGGQPVAGKTGTSQDAADVWFVGYVPSYSTAVWVGIPRGRIPLPEGSYGGTVAAPIWHTYMQRILQGVKIGGEFQKPKEKIKPQEDRVPDVVGMSKDDATAALEAKGFEARINEVEDEGRRNQVLAQSPVGGSKAERGTVVTLDVSTGAPSTATVPNVIGMQQHQAEIALQSEGFGVHIVREVVDQESDNRIVLRQSPRADQEVENGTSVTITVGNFNP